MTAENNARTLRHCQDMLARNKVKKFLLNVLEHVRFLKHMEEEYAKHPPSCPCEECYQAHEYLGPCRECGYSVAGSDWESYGYCSRWCATAGDRRDRRYRSRWD